MSKREKIDQMKTALRSGHVVITNPKSGKTEALVEIYHEDNDSVVILSNGECYKAFVDLYEKKYNKSPDRKFLMVGGLKFQYDEYKEKLVGKKLYLDDMNVNPYHGEFHSGVTSYPHPVLIMKEESGAV